MTSPSTDKEKYYDDLYRQAVEIATLAHEGQTRWGGEPYITHPLAVAAPFNIKTHPREKIVAVLHDVLEDADDPDAFQRELMAKFPVDIVMALTLLTHRPDESYADYIMKIRGDFHKLENALARRVKMADLAHNLSDLGDVKKHKQRRDKYQLALKLLGLPPYPNNEPGETGLARWP